MRSETSIFITSFTHFLPKINHSGAELIVVETTIVFFSGVPANSDWPNVASLNAMISLMLKSESPSGVDFP
jgi:hypothetical protein